MNHSFITPLDLEIFVYTLKMGVSLFAASILIILVTYAIIMRR